MPRRYEEMRDAFIRKGFSEKEAEKKAAKIYNATKKQGQRSVTRKHKKK